MASAGLLRPRSSSVSALITVIGEGVSTSVRRNSEPVTTIEGASVVQAASLGVAAQSTAGVCAEAAVLIIARPSANGAAPAFNAIRVVFFTG